MLSRKIVAVLLILVALTASIEARPRYIVASIAMPDTAASPLNHNAYGTSTLVAALEAAGYNVEIVYGVEDLKALSRGWGEIAYLAIAPEAMNKTLASSILDGLQESGASRIFIIVADELNISQPLVEEAWSRLCDRLPKPVITGPMSGESVKLVVYTGTGRYQAITGYTSMIEVDGDIRYWASLEPPAPVTGGGIESLWALYAFAWPGPDTLPPLSWYPVAYRCSTGNGGLVAIADSTVFVNGITNSTADGLQAALALIHTGIGAPRDGLVILVDQSLYTSPGARLDFKVRFHPSMIMITAARVYQSIEPRIISGLQTHYPLFIAVAFALAAILLTSMPKWSREPVIQNRGSTGSTDGEKLWFSPCRVLESKIEEGSLQAPSGLVLRCRLALAMSSLPGWLSRLPGVRRFVDTVEYDALVYMSRYGYNPLEDDGD